ncbi:Serine acetyltransferase [Melia azedarach]|uniref:Serine acetyltransferase n=1 Tax=Melia azedarach TaxID=155640 RepID=A0ACC1YJR7_MELAZ|nr:Serine acetyltransferase [Melia azedarach]
MSNFDQAEMLTRIEDFPERVWLPDDKRSIERSSSVRDGDDELWLEILSEAGHGVVNWCFGMEFWKLGMELRKHSSLESALADCLASKLTISTDDWYKEWLYECFLTSFTTDPEIRRAIRDDLRAEKECNPTCKNTYLGCFQSPGFLAIQAYRVSHKIWLLNDRDMAHEIQNLASEAFTIDIHPGAKIGWGVSIDHHVTEVVIDETAVIADNVAILDQNTYFSRGNLLDGERYSEISRWAHFLAIKLDRCPFGKEEKFLHMIALKILMEDEKIRKDVRDDLRACSEDWRDYYYIHYSRGFLACLAYRVAHKLWLLNDKSAAHQIHHLAAKTLQIDIHPGAKIGRGVSIDHHATQVVIEETAVIGDYVAILDQNTYFYLLDGESYPEISRWAVWLAFELDRHAFSEMQNFLHMIILKILMEDDKIRRDIRDDLRACSEGWRHYISPYSRGFLACLAYRVAHKLWLLDHKSAAQEIQHLASRAFQIDIHPGAKIGRGISIDDRLMEVVIKETAVIGDNVAVSDENIGGNLLDGVSYRTGLHLLFHHKSLLDAGASAIGSGRRGGKSGSKLRLLDDKSVASWGFGFASGTAATKILRRTLISDDDTGVVNRKRAVNDVTTVNKNFYFLGGNSHTGESYYGMSSQKEHSYGIHLKNSFSWGFHHKYINSVLDVEAIAVGSGHGGGESSEQGDGGDEFHAVQLHQADHDPAPSIELASTALNNTSFASDKNNEQPLSDIERGAEIVEVEPEFDLSSLTKTFLVVSAEEGLATLAVRFGASKSLPENAKILLTSAELFSVAVFLLCYGGYILRRGRRTKPAARLMTAAGGVAATCGFILIMGSLLA